MAHVFPKRSHLLALDWGTSSLRGVLTSASGETLRESSSASGLLSIPANGFRAAFEREFGVWLRDYPDTVVLAAGMIGSRQGWVEAPYVPAPAGFDEVAQGLVWHDDGARIGFVPGVVAQADGPLPDVMRGEETQIFGALDALGLDDGLFVLPGTHSKWAWVRGRRVLRFHTFMTGEIYALLRRQSLLARMMPAEDDLPWAQGRQAFLQGCAASTQGALLQGLFSIRARGLLDRLPGVAQPDYLSGLLIGEEIREALALADGEPPDAVHLICNDGLFARYGAALGQYGVRAETCPFDSGFLGLRAIAQACGLIQ